MLDCCSVVHVCGVGSITLSCDMGEDSKMRIRVGVSLSCVHT